MGAALGSQYRAMNVAAEILIAQIHSQRKLTTAGYENRKILYENELLKAKEPAPDVKKCQISNDTKKHTTKSCETIPLNYNKSCPFQFLIFCVVENNPISCFMSVLCILL
jgi:hypothetical protein